MRAKLIGLILVLGLLVAVPPGAGQLGDGFYFTSSLINTPKTNLLGPRSWVIRASASYEVPSEGLWLGGGGTLSEDVSLGLGLREWLEAGLIIMGMTGEYGGQIQLRLLKETPRRPAVSLGTVTRLDEAESVFYLVAGKHNVSLPLLGKANVYGGVGANGDSEVPAGATGVSERLQGIFLGIEKMHRPGRWKRPLSVMMESDAENINLGLSYELLRGWRVNAAVVKVEKLFGDGDVGVVLALQSFRV